MKATENQKASETKNHVISSDLIDLLLGTLQNSKVKTDQELAKKELRRLALMGLEDAH